MRCGALLCALIVLSLAPAAEASFPGANGRILVLTPTSPGSFDFGMSSVAPDGSGFTPIAASWVSTASSSADGTRIAYGRRETSGYRIAIANPDGSDERFLTTTESQPSTPSWSPDGGEIAFSTLSGGRFALWVMPAAGGNWRLLTDDGFAPEWSPDGRRILFVRLNALWLMNADGTDQKLVKAGATNPEWSPDGSRIAYSKRDSARGGDIFTAQPDGSDERNVTAALPPATDSGFPPIARANPAWSPDGRLIAFSNRPPSGTIETWTVRSNGADPRPIPNTTGSGSPEWAVDTPLAPARTHVASTPRLQRQRRARRPGLRIPVGCAAACVVRGELLAGSGQLGAARTVRIGRGRARLTKFGTTVLTVRVRRPIGVRRLRARLRVRVTGSTKARRTQRVTLVR